MADENDKFPVHVNNNNGNSNSAVRPTERNGATPNTPMPTRTNATPNTPMPTRTNATPNTPMPTRPSMTPNTPMPVQHNMPQPVQHQTPNLPQKFAQEDENSLTVDEIKETDVNEKEDTLTVDESKETDVHEAEDTLVVDEANTATVHQAENEQPQTPVEPENENTDDQTGEAERRPDEPANTDLDSDKKGPFAPKDIIEYMFNDWLIGGMNEAWCWLSKKTDLAYYRDRYEKRRKANNKVEAKEVKEHQTFKDMETLDKMANDDIAKKSESIGRYNSLVETADKIREGKIDETNLSPEAKADLKAADQQKLQQFLNPQSIQKAQENMKMTLEAAAVFSNNYALLMAMDAKMQNSSAEDLKDMKKAFAKYQAEGFKFYAKAIGDAVRSGQDPHQVNQQLMNIVNQGVDKMHKDVTKGNFDGCNKKRLIGHKKGKYKGNEFVDKLNALRNGVDLDNYQPMSFREAVVMSQAYDTQSQYKLDELALSSARAANDNRRNSAHQAIDNMNNPYYNNSRGNTQTQNQQQSQSHSQTQQNQQVPPINPNFRDGGR